MRRQSTPRLRCRATIRRVHRQAGKTVNTLVEDFLQYLRHERGQSDNTAKTYAALLGKFTAWAATAKSYGLEIGRR